MINGDIGRNSIKKMNIIVANNPGLKTIESIVKRYHSR